MGHKVNPTGIRIGWFLPWKSRWFAGSSAYKGLLIEDIKIRKALMAKLKLAGIVSVDIERLPKSINIGLTVSRPGVVIGRGGSGIEEVRKVILEMLGREKGSGSKNVKIDIQVNEIKNPEISAHLVADRIVSELERRIPHRRVINKAMERVMASGAKGIKVVIGGRIQGAEISRVEKYHIGSVPTQTLRETIDYASTPALLKRGYVGIKVWIHHANA